EARDVGRRSGRRGIAAGALREIGTVDPRRTDADQELAVAGNGVGSFLDDEVPVLDDRRTHDVWHGTAMKLDGIHHVTCITGNAPQNVEFYAHTLGLRMVKKTVNQDDPSVYHLFYADEHGSAGADITFFEYPGLPRGRAGDGMVHRIAFRVASEDALDFWESRVGGTRANGSLIFDDPEGLTLVLAVDESGDKPLVARHPEIPEEHAIRGFDGVRAYASAPDRSARFLSALGFEPGWSSRAATRGGYYVYDTPPGEPPRNGAGTVHHVAWAAPMDEHAGWVQRVRE